jgi:hypothetical protein
VEGEEGRELCERGCVGEGGSKVGRDLFLRARFWSGGAGR